MPKLKIVYRTGTDEEKRYWKNETFFQFAFETKNTVISISPTETDKLEEVINYVEDNLKKSNHLDKDEKFEISDFDKIIMEYEKEYDCRIKNHSYNYLKNLYNEGEEALDEALEYLKSEVARRCV